MPTISSIQPPLLEFLARQIVDAIIAVRLNDIHIISDFTEKSVTGSVVTMQYIVSPSPGFNSITKIEFLNSSGAAVTNESVYIPLIEGVEVKSHFDLKEGV